MSDRKLRKTLTIKEELTLQSIAEMNELSIEELARANQMLPPFRADIGDNIEVPLSMVNVEIPPYMPYREIGRIPDFRQANLEVTRMDLSDGFLEKE